MNKSVNLPYICSSNDMTTLSTKFLLVFINILQVTTIYDLFSLFFYLYFSEKVNTKLYVVRDLDLVVVLIVEISLEEK